jgi:HD-GYP domain-containing protein (c-di-GMP phosphodiesterase class II)
MLGAGAVLIERIGDVTAVSLSAEPGSELRIDAATAGRALSEEIQSVRKRNRAQVLSRCTLPSRRLQNTRAKENGSGVDDRVCHVLLAPLRQLRQDPAVVIAVRSSEQSPFDSGDMLASESVLGYGGHILSNMLMVRHLQKMAFETVRALVSAIDQKDNYTCGHAERVGWLAVLTGRALGLGDEDLQQIEWAGLLHDVGKIGIPEAILNKPGPLDAEEWEAMRRHPEIGARLLSSLDGLHEAAPLVLHHQERWDGHVDGEFPGYPTGLAGDEIPLGARIIAVVDCFDAMTTDRPYRRALADGQAREVLRAERRRQFDPRVVDTFLAILDEAPWREPG